MAEVGAPLRPTAAAEYSADDEVRMLHLQLIHHRCFLFMKGKPCNVTILLSRAA